MNRRELLEKTAIFGLAGAVGFSLAPSLAASVAEQPPRSHAEQDSQALPNALKPPAQGSIPIAFVLSKGAVVIDFCGPWEVFENVQIPGRDESPFKLYTVAKTMEPIQTSGGMRVVPNYTFNTAPAPKVIVIPAQSGTSDAMLDWIRKSSQKTDVTMSVCAGAFVLARTGLLSGKAATTYHNAYKAFAVEFPDVQLKRGKRFVEDGNLATAGGLTSGIDLALRVVERYYGRSVAADTADRLEYQGQGWLNADSNEVYAKAPVSTDQHPLCPVCDMEVDRKTALKSVYKGKTYLFCMREHKAAFDRNPEKYLNFAEQ